MQNVSRLVVVMIAVLMMGWGDFVGVGGEAAAGAEQRTPQAGADETTPSVSMYFTWINNTMEGATEEQTLTNMDFAAWARVQAERAGHELPGFDPAQAEATGWARARHVRALGLVRALYPRSLEIYLALDRAVALEEQGREVQLGLFCASEVTPRNLLILAR